MVCDIINNIFTLSITLEKIIIRYSGTGLVSGIPVLKFGTMISIDDKTDVKCARRTMKRKIESICCIFQARIYFKMIRVVVLSCICDGSFDLIRILFPRGWGVGGVKQQTLTDR